MTRISQKSSDASRPAKPLLGKVALVTGGSRGMGAAIVQRLAADGATVAFTFSNSAEKAHEVVRAVTAANGKALAIHADARDAAAVKAAVDETVRSLGRLDILVNNAGTLVVKPIHELSDADFDNTVDVNVKAVFVASREAARHMDAGGRIINIGSINADRMPFAGGALYALSKAAIVGLTKGMARDLGPRGITVNNVQPGPVATDMNPATGAFADQLHSFMALDRHGKPEEIASFVAYLAGPEAAYITGASLDVDGGFGA